MSEKPARPARFILECGHRLDVPDYPGDPSYVYCEQCDGFRKVKQTKPLPRLKMRISPDSDDPGLPVWQVFCPNPHPTPRRLTDKGHCQNCLGFTTRVRPEAAMEVRQ